MKNYKITGFTLAEVLVTLAVIGVISSIVMGMLKDVTTVQHKTAFKTAYSQLNEGTLQILNENGSLYGLFTSSNQMRDYFKLHLKYVKSCDYGSESGVCWHENGKLKHMDGTSCSDWEGAALILVNGIFVLFGNESVSCNNELGGVERCGQLIFDVNGFKGPNTIGKDIFYVHVMKDNIYPFGFGSDDYGCDSSSSAWQEYQGWGCAAKVLKNEEYE